jgi:hypothetical protein
MNDTLYGIIIGILICLFLIWIIYRISIAIERHNHKKYLDWLNKTHIETVDLTEAQKKRIDELYENLQYQLDKLDEYNKKFSEDRNK